MGRSVSRNVTLELGLSSLEAKRKLDRQKIFLPTRPDDALPELPEDPTELSDSALMVLFTRLTKWSEYIGAQLAVAEVDERYADASLEKIRIFKGIDLRTNAGKAAAKDEDYWEAHEAHQERHAYRKLLSAMFNNAERNSAMLSRELTRRVNRDVREGRVDRYGA